MKNFDESSFFAQWICSKCGYIYDENIGDPDGGIAPGTRFEDIPENWVCPVCGAKKSAFRIVKRRVLVKNVLIIEKNHLTNDVIELKVDLGEDLDYENGQFLNFVFNDEKGIIQRAYSIVSKENNIFTFLIKIGDGRGSLVLKNSRVGDNLGFTHISGDFLLQKSKNQKVFIASGTGLAPIFNMINSLNNEEKIILYFGVRAKKDLFYIDKLTNIKNLELKVYLSKEKLDDYNFGRINLNNINYNKNTEFYICGNPSLLKDTKEALIKQGYNNIYFEDYLN